jgi:two-component system sensor histidine kinase ChvG
MNVRRFLPAFTLRTKLALAALVLLALPWTGYRYVSEMERYLLEGEERNLLATARAVATALHDRPGLAYARPLRDTDPRRLAEEELQRLSAEREQGEAQRQTQAGLDALPPGEERPAALPARASVPTREETQEIGQILRGLERTTSRIWVVTRDLRVLALAGSLRREGAGANNGWLQRALGGLIQRPREDFDDAIEDSAFATSREITGALQGRPGVRLRRTPDGRAMIISAAHPIWNGHEVFGAVVVEESTNPILSVRSQALERLLLLTLVAFAVAAAVLLGFATRLSSRIRRLRDEAETAIDPQGRVAHLVTAQNAGDEIGDLSRSFSALLARLGQYNAYLESMASRLSHELRTPIAVVRSSLENLKLAPTQAESRVYIERAEEGLRRLGTILTRMSEATRLEQSLRAVERETFDIAAVVKGCVEGYRLAYPKQRFDLALALASASVSGAPDLVAQLLDKLIANAVDFSLEGEPVRVSLLLAPAGNAALAELRIENRGPLLPASLDGKLFQSMISGRSEPVQSEPHLGLGLFVARLIVEFHGGTIRAENLSGGDGVVVTATFKLA